MAAYRRSVTLNYFRTGLRILFTTFLETETHLLKLMWVFLGCCIGSSASPLHPPLLMKIDYVADLKNMNEANYKDTRITLAEAASAIFVVDFEHVLVCWDIFRSNKLQNPKN